MSDLQIEELVKVINWDRESATTHVELMSQDLTPEEKQGLMLFAKGVASAPKQMDRSLYESQARTLERVVKLPVTDTADRVYAVAWLAFMKGLSVNEGQVEGERNEPDKDEGPDSVGVRGAAGSPAGDPADDDAESVEE